MKMPVVIRKEYIIYLERYNGLSYAHCDAYKWNKTTKASFLKDWETLCLLHSEPIYVVQTVGDKKLLKFLRMCGFRFLFSRSGNDLKEYAIYVKESQYGKCS